MDIVIRGQTSFRSIAARATAGTLAMSVNADVLAASARPAVSIILGAIFIPEDWRITEDGEVRLTEDNQPRQVDG